MLFRFNVNTPQGSNCKYDSNIKFDGTRKIGKDGVAYAIDSCNIIIEKMQSAHNGTWRCEANTAAYGVISDTINITTIHNNDVTISTGAILGITIPLGVLLIVCIVLLLVWCLCPIYIALCCCCIPACREKRDAAYQKTDYTQTVQRRSSSSHSVGTQSIIPPLPPQSKTSFLWLS